MMKTINNLEMMIVNKDKLLIHLTGSGKIHKRIVELKMINKRMKDYKWMKHDVVSSA